MTWGDTENEVWYLAARNVLGPYPEVKEKLTMLLTTPQTLSLPLRTDEGGAIRVGNSRVVLDVIIREFLNGADAEAIARAYPTLELADVYAVIAYYLRHREEVDDYLRDRRLEAQRLREEIETARGPDNFRETLLARWARRGQKDASPTD
jgi:uncharacterized protein (DUF433 family)